MVHPLLPGGDTYLWIAHVVLEVHELHRLGPRRPDAVRPAEVGDAGIGADTGAGEYRDPLGSADVAGYLFDRVAHRSPGKGDLSPLAVTVTSVADRPLELLHAIAGPDADFRAGQREAIDAVVTERRRVLLVQRTGWGKSAVYFIATRLLRDAGAGPTILVSPLLALMRNQIRMAERAGVVARTINSGNRDDWEEITSSIERDEVDLLLVSPERFNNPAFRAEVLPQVAARSGRT
jgi:superfamily II DNA helicase RecQ